ncbi:MAG: efflux RND transporter permease subunit, partial [Saprospiraceae bacterium]
ISLEQIQTAVAETNILQSIGYINDHNRLYLTLTDNAIDNLKELQDLVLVNLPNRLIRLSDVAVVELDEVKEYVKINANGKDVPLIAVLKQPDANLIDVNEGVEKRVEELKLILPKDVKLIPYYKQADFVSGSIKSIRDVLGIGLLLAIFVVILFLRSAGTSIVVLVTIPVTIGLTFFMLKAIGYTFNIMTLGAIAAAIGLMIDDAVIVVEQIHRSHEEDPDEPMPSIIRKSMKYLFPALLGSSLSTIVIFIPFSLMSGIAGAYFKVLAYTMVITLSASFIVTWIILPAIFLFVPLKMKNRNKEIKHRTGWISFFIHRPVISFVFLFLCGLAIWWIPSKLQSGFLPEMDEGSIVLDYTSPPGTTLEETDRMLQQLDNILKHQPEVEKFSRRTGTQMGFFITEPNFGDYLIQLKTQRSKSTDEVSDEIRQQIEAGIPQLVVDFGQVIGDMLGDLMSSVQPIELKLFGDNEEGIEDLSRQIADVISNVPGTADVFDGIVIAGPQINIQPDVPKLAQFGLTPSDLQFQLQTQIEGTVISTIFEKEQQVDIRMIYPQAQNTSVHSLADASILLPGGMMKPVQTVANIEIRKGVAEINRENQKIMGVITARLNNRDLGTTLKEIKQTLQDKIVLPPGYHIEYGGSYAQQQQAFKELLLILLTASLLVFIVMLFLFRQIFISFIIILLAIAGMAGSMVALYITGTQLNVGSYTGIIMIVGIIGENAIFTYWQYLKAQGTLEREQSILQSIAVRLRPNLMTALGAIVALLPLALGIGTGAQLHQPLAIAVIGGFVLALPLLLIILPTLLKTLKL